MAQYTYTYNGETYTIQLDKQPDGSYRALIGDRVYSVKANALANGGLLLAIDGQRAVAYTASEGSTRHVMINGQNFTLSLPETRRKRAAGAGGFASLNAEMPGQVIEVLAREGETVTRGQTLVVLEAMKMEMRVGAPTDGIVRRVLVAKGDVVERGQALVEVGGD